MNCRKVFRRLSAYIEDDLSSTERSKIDIHLKSCSHCRRQVADLRKIIETAGELDRFEPGPYFVNRVLCAVGQKKSPREILSGWKYRLSLSGVAFVVAASMTFFIIGPPATVMVDSNSGAVEIEAVDNMNAEVLPGSDDRTTDGFPVPPEALERDLALEEKPLPDSLNTGPEILSRRYVQPVSIRSDSNKAF